VVLFAIKDWTDPYDEEASPRSVAELLDALQIEETTPSIKTRRR
jgi:hypothetical protein